MTIRLSRMENLIYWRLVEYLGAKFGKPMSEIHAEFYEVGLSPVRAKFDPAWDEPLRLGVASRFLQVKVGPSWYMVQKARKEARRGKDSSGSRS